ncbi:hypothetical protein [Nocardia sp. NPDC047038]|uniref:hypothetical protein n=1 Tax=Nocardia sp. NPDC047038 TaxID=3154338 RepID=UPI0033E7B4FE
MRISLRNAGRYGGNPHAVAPVAIAIFQQVTPHTDGDRTRAKRELVPLIREFQGNVRYKDDSGTVWEPADWWMNRQPLQWLAVADGAVTVSVYSCTGDCSASALALAREFAAGINDTGMVQADFQRSETDTAAILAAATQNHVEGKRYPVQLPPELAPWYVYPNDCGHGIAVVPASHAPAGNSRTADLAMLLTPNLVRSVQRLRYKVVRGFVVCPVQVLGVVSDPADEEW